MENKEYVNNKIATAYKLFKNNKFTWKARAIVIKDFKLLVIKITYNNGKIHYLFPGGTVDEGESIKTTVIRECLEEYNINVSPIKLIGKQYYNIEMNHNGEIFKSRNIDYYYICEYVSDANNSQFGIDGEFNKNDRTHKKTTLSINDLTQLNHKDLNDMNKKNFDKLIEYMKTLK